jgi:protoporphyrinogen oxidase
MNETNQKTWAIIGGGVVGMTLALRLVKQGYKVTILETASEPGGLAASWKPGSFTWDRFYHVILMSDSHTRRVLDEIGLANDFRWVETKTGFYSGGKLYSMSDMFEFLKFPPLSLIDKFRLGLTILAASRITNWEKLEKVTVSEWLNKWSGRNVFNKIWLPLLKAKLGENYKLTSAAFIWSTIQRMYAARRSGLKKEMFGYVSGGYHHINTTFSDTLANNGVDFQLNTAVQAVTKTSDGKLTVQTTDNRTLIFDQVISTLSPQQTAAIAPELSASEKDKLNKIKYLGVVCPSVILSKSISKYYVTNITDDVAPFTGVIEMSALVDKEAEFEGLNLIYLPKYVNPDDGLFETGENDIRKEFLGALFRMYPQLSDADVQHFAISKARVVFPLPVLGYSQMVPGVTTSIPGFYMINSSQIINGTLNVNESIHVAEKGLKQIFSGINN